jgi:hypothetical protein
VGGVGAAPPAWGAGVEPLHPVLDLLCLLFKLV